MNKILDVFFDSTKYSILTQMRTGNVFYDTLITTAIISIFTYFYNYIYEIKGIKFLNSIISLFYKKNCIILEGKKCSVVSNYSHEQKISVSYSDRFKAILDYIVKNIDNQKSIYQLKEFYHNIIDNKKNGNKTIGETLIVNQYKAPPFRIITRAWPLDSRRFEGEKGRKWLLPPQTTRTAKRAGIKNLQLMIKYFMKLFVKERMKVIIMINKKK